MKTQSSPSSILRSLSAALLLTGVLASTASAAILTEFRTTDVPSGASPVPAFDWVDGIANVNSLIAHGTIIKTAANAGYSGWTNAIDFNNYVGFSIVAEDGFSLILDNIQHASGSSSAGASRMGSIAFGYRIDTDGAGAGTFGEWVLTTPLVFGDADFGSTAKTWQLGITTTGIVEFGYFGAANANGGGRFNVMGSGVGQDIIVNGSVAAVPEPSTYGMILAAGLVALILARRRKATISA